MGYKNLQFDKRQCISFVTGGAGFIGSNLCEAILDMGYQGEMPDDLSTGKQENVEMFLDRPDIPLLKEISAIWKPAGVPATVWIMC